VRQFITVLGYLMLADLGGLSLMIIWAAIATHTYGKKPRMGKVIEICERRPRRETA
jgi:hypothetical protein